jgi:hypothetical protein
MIRHTAASRSIDIETALVVDTSTLKDDRGEPISLETWLPQNLSRLLGRDVVYLSTGIPFVFPQMLMNESELQAFRLTTRDEINKLYRELGVLSVQMEEGTPSGPPSTPPPRFAPPSGEQSVA